MFRVFLPAVALLLLAGCATNEPQVDPQFEPQYQIGIAGERQTKVEAERALAAATPKAVQPTDLDAAPRILVSPFPGYPPNLRRAGIEGRVIVRFTVEVDGSVGDPVAQGAPPPELADLALGASRQWRFVPAMKEGVPVRARLAQPFLFVTE